MMSCNENARSLRVARMEEIRDTGADMMITSCPKCVSHFECLKFEGDEKYDIEILDVVSFLAKQVEASKSKAKDVILLFGSIRRSFGLIIFFHTFNLIV